jgi:uncharacterized small protein (DUF1192 family)
MDIEGDQDYLRALMEAVNTLSLDSLNKPGKEDPRIPILQEEIRRVRADRKAADPTFKTRKVSVDKLMNRKASSSQKVAPQKLLPAASEEGGAKDQTIITSNLAERLSSIQDALQSLGRALGQQLRLDKKVAAVDARNAKEADKLSKESKLEKKKKSKFGGFGFKKLIKPVSGFFDTILNFFKNVFIGSILVGMLDWMKDNEDKVIEFKNFFTEHLNKILIGLGALAGLVLLGPLMTLFKILKWVTFPLRWIFGKFWNKIFPKAASKALPGASRALRAKPPGKSLSWLQKLNPFRTPASKTAANKIVPFSRGAGNVATETPWAKIGKFFTGGGRTRLGKTGANIATRTGSKGMGALPLIGIAWDLGAAVYRFGQGDAVGGLLSLGSAIPILGWGVAALDIAREFGAFEGTPLRMSEGSLLNKIQTPQVQTPPITSPTGTGNIEFLDLRGGGASTAPVASGGDGSGEEETVPSFSSQDPNNMTTVMVRSIYGLVN